MNLRILPLLMLCAPLTAEEPGVMAAVAAQNPAGEYAALLQQITTLLNGVHDQAGADAAAKHYISLYTKLDSMEDNGPEDISDLYAAYEASKERVEQNYFYGSQALANAMVGNPSRGICPSPVTPQIESELAERLQLAYSLLPDVVKKGVSGGPGLSKETAWVITTEKPHAQRAEYIFTHLFQPYRLIGLEDATSSTLLRSRVEHTETHIYRIYSLELPHRGKLHHVEMWEDVTGCYKRVSAEEARQAIAEFSALMEDWITMLEGVCTPESAQAATAILQQHRQRYFELKQILVSRPPAETEPCELAEARMHDLLYDKLDTQPLDYVYDTNNELTKPDRERALQAIHQEILKRLNNAQDKASADAAADFLNDMHGIAHIFLHRSIDYDLERNEDMNPLILQEQERLKATRYYGSAPLAKTLAHEYDAYEPQELTPEVALEIEHLIREALALSPREEHRSFTGGPGFTKETAWNIPAKTLIALNNDLQEIQLPLIILFPDYRFEMNGSYTTEEGFFQGRLYERTPIRVLLNGKLYHYAMWIDFTDGHYVPTEEEYHTERAKFETSYQERLRILESVHDTASANAAAELLREWRAAPAPLWHPLGNPLSYLEQALNLFLQIQAAEEKLCKVNCYESTALKILLYTPKGKGTTQTMELSPAEKEAWRRWRTQQSQQKTYRYVQVLQKELPQVRDTASALALAKTLHDLDGESIYSHINLLKYYDADASTNTLPIRRHLQRIKNALYYGAIDLANILEERSGPSGPGFVEQEHDDVTPAE